MSLPNLIEIKSLEITYPLATGSSLKAIAELNWNVEEGLFTSIIGPSGCGKSTLLRAFAGLQKISNGYLRVNLPEQRTISDISMTFQTPTLLPWLSVEKNILLPFTLASHDISRDVFDKLLELLELVGLSKFRTAFPHELSGGMCMRIALVRAFITGPKLILMDEPFAALDELTRDRLCIELEKLWLASKSTIVFVTHNLTEAILLSDRVAILSDHPGTLINEIEIPLPRPRQDIMKSCSEFSSLLGTLRSELNNSEQLK